MRSTARALFSTGLIALLTALALLPACRRGPTARSRARPNGVVPALGAHVLLTHDQNRGVTPAITAPITTRAAGSTLLALSMGRNPNFAVPTDSYGNRWSAIGRRNRYAGLNGRFYTAMWSAAEARGGAGHTLSATKVSDPADEIDLALIEIANGGGVQDAVYAYPRAGEGPHTPGAVRTNGPATLIAVWGGDSDDLPNTAVPSDGFQVIDSYLALGPTSGVQVAIAVKQVATAGTYGVTWTATPPQGAACYLIAVEGRGRGRMQ
jgi:hypothetical protein